ncbi:MAG: AAA family ATPase [Methanomassiliicoccaceae archaeon]|nr:AAA family ATPase [Methanomassiliicoccaceae archaeon]
MNIIFLGTSSNAGKTLISALFCRYLRSKMIMVSPFKALNLSSRSFVTDDGSEIGVGQALQAWASDIRPNGRMNPVLMKADGGKIKVIVNGARENIDTSDRGSLLSRALWSFDELSDMFEAVVAEGSGSPAEINLRDHDVANMNFASSRNIPAILVGDIEKGGVFAGIYGTWLLTEEKNRHLMKGFIINKYYGDKEILKSGIGRIEELTGMRCLGVIPYIDVSLPEEDTFGSAKEGYSDIEIDAFIASLDSIIENITEHIDMEALVRIASGSSA